MHGEAWKGSPPAYLSVVPVRHNFTSKLRIFRKPTTTVHLDTHLEPFHLSQTSARWKRDRMESVRRGQI